MTNTLLLKGAIVRNGFSIASLSAAVGISKQSMSYKINNKRSFTAREIAKVSAALKLSSQERDLIFFENDVD